MESDQGRCSTWLILTCLLEPPILVNTTYHIHCGVVFDIRSSYDYYFYANYWNDWVPIGMIDEDDEDSDDIEDDDFALGVFVLGLWTPWYIALLDFSVIGSLIIGLVTLIGLIVSWYSWVLVTFGCLWSVTSITTTTLVSSAHSEGYPLLLFLWMVLVWISPSHSVLVFQSIPCLLRLLRHGLWGDIRR